MAKLKPQRLRASALLEVIVAMIIILIVFVLAAQIYARVLGSSPSVQQAYFRAIAEKQIEKCVWENDLEDKDISIDSLNIARKILPYNGFSDLFICKVSLSMGGKELGAYQRLFKKRKEDRHE